MGRTLLGIWAWFAFGLVSSIGFCVCLILFLLTSAFDKTRKLTGRAIRIVGICMVRAVPAWRFSARGPFPSRLPERLVVVSNHESNLDPFLIAHLPWEMKYLAKSVLFRIPAVGWGIFIAGDIPLVRGSTRSIRQAMKRAAFYVENGMPVCIFPEGTRSETSELLPFKDGAFRLAIEQKAHVLPVAVSGTARALNKGDFRPRPARALVACGEPISTEGMSLSDVAELKDRVRIAVEEVRERLRAELSAPA